MIIILEKEKNKCMKIEIITPEFKNVIDPNQEIEVIADGFSFTEGPLWNAQNDYLLFSDIPSNRIFQWKSNEDLKVFREPSSFSNGLTYDRSGRLIACEHQSRSVTTQSPDGSITIIASTYQGKRLNSPNDVITVSDGSVIFSDPIYGLRRGMGGPAEQELDFEGIYRIPPEGEPLQLLCNNFERPNGLCLSPDEKKLFIADTVRQHIRVFEIASDWKINGGQIWAELWDDGLIGRPDGMKMDIHGNLFCTGPGGIWIFNHQASLLGRIYLPDKTSNLAWGEDGHSLFITCSATVFRVRCLTKGRSPLENY